MTNSTPDSSLQDIRRQLIARGYKILPNAGKVPQVKGWNIPGRVDKLMQTARRWHAASTGIIVCDGLAVIDIDIDDAIAEQVMEIIARLAPDVYSVAPTRFGPTPYKRALFARLESEPFACIKTFSYARPGEDEAQHKVEIFGGGRYRGGKYSRQFGAYGAYINDDGVVTGAYRWDAATPELYDVALADLPALTREQVDGITAAIEALLDGAGWSVKRREKSDGGSAVYDITDESRFDCNNGASNITYEELSDLWNPRGDLRCSSSFIEGRDGSRRDRCWVFWSNQHNCVGVYVYGDEQSHYPVALAPAEVDDEELREALKQMKDNPRARPQLDDFHAFLPTHQYIYRPNGALWVGAALLSILDKVTVGKKLKKQSRKDREAGLAPEAVDDQIPATLWLDRNRPIAGMTWVPGHDELITGILPEASGWREKPGAVVFNTYRAPTPGAGDAAKAGPWLEMLRRVYPNHIDHLVAWMAHRIQRPGEKINHALVLTGAPGIGKDTLLEPLRHGVGSWNFRDVSPRTITGKYGDYMRSVVLRISESHDLGDTDRYKFYELMKTIIAAPPDMAEVNPKYVPQYYVPNVTGVIITSNYGMDGLYLTPDDRRHYVCGTEHVRSDAWDTYCRDVWAWYAASGLDHVVAYLRACDLAGFNAGEPPPKTAAFWRMVDAGRPVEENEIRDAITALGKPPVLTIAELLTKSAPDLQAWLYERKNARNVGRRLADCGYVPVRNPGDAEGRWMVMQKRVTIYGSIEVPEGDRLRAAEKLKQRYDQVTDAIKGKKKP